MCDPRRAASIQLPEIEPPLRRGSGPLDLFAATIPPPFLRPISSEVRTHGRNREGEPVAEISPLSSARMPPAGPVRSPGKTWSAIHILAIATTTTRLAGALSTRVGYRPARVVALDRDRCSTQRETPAPTAIPITAS